MPRMEMQREEWAFARTFAIARAAETSLHVVVVRLHGRDGAIGRGEAAGVDYDGETAQTIMAALEAVRPAVERGAGRDAIQTLLPPGGARNALDCALWDLEARETGMRVRDRLGLPEAVPVRTAATIGLGDAETTAAAAAELATWPLIKIKLDQDRHLETVALVRRHCPDAELIVDPNQAWTFDRLCDLAPRLADLGVTLIEQPLPREADAELSGYRGPVPLCADESCATAADLPRLAGRYRLVNIKLDKTGGLTAALHLSQAARACGMGLMVGCMAGTSLAMAPALLLADDADYVDLDGPMLHARDRAEALRYADGKVHPVDAALWG